MTNAVEELKGLGQSVWYDNIRRGLIESGELERLIGLGVCGLTSNPTIFEKAIAAGADYDQAILDLARRGKSAKDIYEELAVEDIRSAADLLRPVYDRTGGGDGYASLEVSPHLAHDTEGTVTEAKRLLDALGRPNVMIKVPGTPEGIPAVRRLIGDGVNVNVTLLFSVAAYARVRDSYAAGLEDLDASGGDVGKVASVASFFVSRVDTAVDGLLGQLEGDGVKELGGKAAIANASLAYRDFREDLGAPRFAALSSKGARAQRPLWASTSTKNPAYSDVMYVESLIGPDTVNTMPEETLMAMMEHGRATVALGGDASDAERVLRSLEDAGVNMEEVTDRLLAEGVKSFADSYDSLVANIERKRLQLLSRHLSRPTSGPGTYEDDVSAAVDEMERSDVVGRIWRSDHTLWKPEPDEITNRLGWLDIPLHMRGEVDSLQEFAAEVRDEGFRHVVLLGMGGTSLGPEVLRQVLGSAGGYPTLTVLDSSLPDRVQEVGQQVDPARTLFLVSSKSGTTVEPNALYRHFRGLVARGDDSEHAGHQFVAITDEGTPLEQLAHQESFRSVFLNPADIGGRYSVLSYFGMVPAALMGLDIAAILERAASMREACGSGAPGRDNPGAWLGAAMGAPALKGRDKLTLVCSPSIESFGLWAEQLLAESTGKEGRGIVPVAYEPLMEPGSYGDDRLFVQLRVQGDDNSVPDRRLSELEAAGHPAVRLELRERYDLGAEFYRWELATAVAGWVMGINPFDQPDVQRAKELTEGLLAVQRGAGELPRQEATGSAGHLLTQAKTGDYLGIHAFVRQTAEVDRALAGLRKAVAERHGIATTSGYGPRFLHSTGQIHKGGPDSGLFLQLTSDHAQDLPVPEEAYTLGVLADAQALGDLRALRERGRRAVRVHLGRDVVGGIEELAKSLGR